MDIIKNPSLQLLLGFGICTAYVPGILGASIPTGWFFLIILMPVIFCFCEFKIGFGFLFIAYSALSLLWTENLNIGFFFLLELIALSCVYYLGENIKDLKPIFKGLALGLSVSSLLALMQYKGYGKEIFTIDNSPAGLFLNPNIYSELSVVILISLVIFKLYWWIPVTLPGILLVHSRAALLALGIGLVVFLYKKNKIFTVLIVLSITIISVIFYWQLFNLNSIQERFNLWVDTIRGLTLFGNGIGSFEILYPLHALNIDTSLARPRYAHNDLLQLIFEAGVGVLLLIPLMTNIIKAKSEIKIIFYSIGIISLFAFPFHVPVFAFIGCLVAGHLNNYNGAVRHIRNNK